jgi:predicted RNase H-like nuclease
MSLHVVGVDGCKCGWIAAKYAPDIDRLTFATHADFSSLLLSYPEAASIAVDIPIGLIDCLLPRPCDMIARRHIGSRSSSVFPAPVAFILDVLGGFRVLPCSLSQRAHTPEFRDPP